MQKPGRLSHLIVLDNIRIIHEVDHWNWLTLSVLTYWTIPSWHSWTHLYAVLSTPWRNWERHFTIEETIRKGFLWGLRLIITLRRLDPHNKSRTVHSLWMGWVLWKQSLHLKSCCSTRCGSNLWILICRVWWFDKAIIWSVVNCYFSLLFYICDFRCLNIRVVSLSLVRGTIVEGEVVVIFDRGLLSYRLNFRETVYVIWFS